PQQMGDKLVLRFLGVLETTQDTVKQSHGVPPVSVALDHTTLKEEDSCGYSSVKTVRSIVYSHQHFSRIPSERPGSRSIPYANACCPESQSRGPAGARHLSGPLRTTVSPLHQPGERGALPHRSAPGPGAEELRHHRCGGGRHLDRMLTIFIDR